MRFTSANALPAPLASRARAAYGLVGWLLVLLLVFDQLSAPWHAHRHNSGIDGTVVAAVHSGAIGSETHAEAADDRPLWVHATTLLRSEAGWLLTVAGDTDHGPVPLWPADRLAPAVEGARLAVASQRKLPPPAHRSHPPPPQAPPWRA